MNNPLTQSVSAVVSSDIVCEMEIPMLAEKSSANARFFERSKLDTAKITKIIFFIFD